jgi:hypothetical protein
LTKLNKYVEYLGTSLKGKTCIYNYILRTEAPIREITLLKGKNILFMKI